MNREELLENHERLCGSALQLMRRKNHDYAGRGGESPFANFTRCESMGICTTEQGFLVRLTDKLSRLSSFIEAGTLQVKDESVEDTILDVINYAVLFQSYLQEKKERNHETLPDPRHNGSHRNDHHRNGSVGGRNLPEGVVFDHGLGSSTNRRRRSPLGHGHALTGDRHRRQCLTDPVEQPEQELLPRERTARQSGPLHRLGEDLARRPRQQGPIEIEERSTVSHVSNLDAD